MKVVITACELYDTILEEFKEIIVFERDSKLFEGPLFLDMDDKVITKVYKTLEIESDNEVNLMTEVFKIYIKLCQEFNIKLYDSTLACTRHWSYIKGFTNDLNVRNIELGVI